MFPKHVDVNGIHLIESAARDPHGIGKKYAKVWYRAAVTFGGLGLVAAFDTFIGASSEAYMGMFLLLSIPLGLTITT